MEIHVGRNSRIMKCMLASKDYREQHSHLFVGISRFLSAKNVLRAGAVVLLRMPSCGQVRWVVMADTYTQFHWYNCPNAIFGRTRALENAQSVSNSLPKLFKYTTTVFVPNVHDSPAATGSWTEHWKRPRRESLGRSREGSKSLR